MGRVQGWSHGWHMRLVHLSLLRGRRPVRCSKVWGRNSNTACTLLKPESQAEDEGKTYWAGNTPSSQPIRFLGWLLDWGHIENGSRLFANRFVLRFHARVSVLGDVLGGRGHFRK